MVPAQKRKPNRKALFLLILFFFTVVTVLFLTSPLAKVRAIDVVGNAHIPGESILKASQVAVGMNFWEVKKTAVNERIENQFPLIAKADVAVHFPGKVVIAVAEKPVAAVLIQKGGKLFRLLSDGTIYDQITKADGTSLPILYAVDRDFSNEIGKRISDPEIQSFSEQIVKVDRALLEHISDFSAVKKGEWSAQTMEGFEIKFPPTQIETTLNVYVKFWKKKLENQPPGVIYIYEPDFAYYQPRSGQSQTNKE